jgi:hypothetical protein
VHVKAMPGVGLSSATSSGLLTLWRSDAWTRARRAASARGVVRLALTSLAVAAAIAWLNRHHIEQQDIYLGVYLPMADYFRGGPLPAVITYPLWGYPALLAFLPTPAITSVALQVLLAVGLVVALDAMMAPLIASRRLARTLCVAAIPVWSLASLKLADPWAAMLGAFAVVALARALTLRRLRWAVASGACFGAALNFRSDLVGVLPVLFAVLALLAPRLAWSRRREIVVTAGVAFAAIVPWGLFRVAHGEPFGISSTNGGMVLCNALGFEGNPWGIVGTDLERVYDVRRALGPDASPVSVEGDRYLRGRALGLIRAHPEQYARKVLHDLVASVALGSYGMEVEPFLHEDDSVRFGVLKEQLKLQLGMAPNTEDIERFRRAGVWSDAPTLASIPTRVLLAAGLRTANSLLTGAFLLVTLMASLWIIVADRRWLERPAVATLLAAFLSTWGFVCATWYQPRYTNGLYVLGLPILLIALESVRSRHDARDRIRKSRFVFLRFLADAASTANTRCTRWERVDCECTVSSKSVAKHAANPGIALPIASATSAECVPELAGLA